MTPPASFKILPSSSQRLMRKESQEVKSGREQPAFSPSQKAMCPRYTTIKRMCGFFVFSSLESNLHLQVAGKHHRVLMNLPH